MAVESRVNRQISDQKMKEHILSLLKELSIAKCTIGLYLPMIDEPNLLDESIFVGHRPCFPYFSFNNPQSMKFVFWSDWMTHRSNNRPFLPDDGEEVIPDLIFVPGLAFDKYGVRLGRGGGFYDYYLQRVNTKSFGVCYQWQVQECLPRENWDQIMDGVITENGRLKLKG